MVPSWLCSDSNALLLSLVCGGQVSSLAAPHAAILAVGMALQVT
jgi:hypothetical protein